MIFAPDYYAEFRCIAADCRHSCCVGWEIDIDSDSRAFYRTIKGSFGERLASVIDDGGESAHFRLTADERCPLLRDDGLCEMILTLGEESLCQICADHPRFRNFYGGRTEIGLGLCCEAAGQLILARSSPMRIVPLADDGDPTPLNREETEFLARRDVALSLLADDTVSLEARIAALLAHGGASIPPRGMEAWREIYRSLERLDPAWDTVLDTLTDAAPSDAAWEKPFARLLEYFLYRHLPAVLDDGRYAARIAFCVFSTEVIRALFAVEEMTLARLVDLARRYSAEIEYDEDNVETLLDILSP